MRGRIPRVSQYIAIVASIVDRVNKLLALATSPNMHEARNAALLAAKLIREHALEIREPEIVRRKTPRPTPRPTPKPRRPSSKKNMRVPPIIESPLGGDCVVCGRRYRAGAEVHWSDAEGGIHTSCIGEWSAKR
jgi:hypothetical protein